MMYGHSNGMSGWGYLLMIAALLFVVGLVATGVLMLIRSGAAGRGPASGLVGRQEAERTLEQRFARGEVDQDEFQSRMDVLRRNAQP